MFRFGDQLTDHGLNYANVAVEGSAKDPPYQRNPDVGGESEDYHAEHSSGASHEQHWLSSNAVGESPPVHAHHGLRERKGRDEQAGVGGCIFFIANLESLDELPGIGEDRGESDGFGEANNGYRIISQMLVFGVILGGAMYRGEIVVASGSRPDYGSISVLLGSLLQIKYAQSYDFRTRHCCRWTEVQVQSEVSRILFFSGSGSRESW